MSIKQISVFVENKKGSLEALVNTLTAAHVDMRAMTIADTQEFGILRMIVDKHAEACAALTAEAARQGVKLVVFPELCLTGATCGDLYAHDRLLRGAMEALQSFAEETAAYDVVSVVGLPVAFADQIYDCAAVVSGGMVLGLVPKTHLSAAERRVFAPAPAQNAP